MSEKPKKKRETKFPPIVHRFMDDEKSYPLNEFIELVKKRPPKKLVFSSDIKI